MLKTAIVLALPLACMLLRNCGADPIRTEIDNETGMKIHYLTGSAPPSTIAYPTCRTWSRDSRHVFVESILPRPEGVKAKKQRHLLRIDANTGEATRLATLETEDTEGYGAAHIRFSPQYHFDYAPAANVIAYFDLTGRNLYLLDVATGKSARVLHEPEGTIGDPPAITPDGRRIVYYVLYPAVGNRFIGKVTSVVFSLDVDPVLMKPVGEPRIVTAFPARVIAGVMEKRKFGLYTNHCQVNPVDPDHFCYSHEYAGVPPDGSAVLTRTWQNRDGIDRPVYTPKPGEWQSHEVIGPLGKSLYFVSSWKVMVVDFATGTPRVIYDNKDGFNPNHITLSPDEKWIAADVWDAKESDENMCSRSGILLIETATGKAKMLCRFLRGQVHPRHPHPNFSPDGRRIAFTVAEGKDNCQVAYVDVADTIRQWK